MTQSLLNLMSSPSAVIAILLWVILLFLVIQQCKRWAKASQKEKIFYQNHPSIPVKEYKLSEFVVHEEVGKKPKLILSNKRMKPKLDPKKQMERLATFKNAWDI